MRARKAKAARRSARSKAGTKEGRYSDRALICECCVYAQVIAAFEAGFKADPCDDKVHAEATGDRYGARALATLQKLAGMKATTAEGLDAKARILPMILAEDHGGMEPASEEFYLSFVADVRRFLEPIIDGNSKSILDPTAVGHKPNEHVTTAH